MAEQAAAEPAADHVVEWSPASGSTLIAFGSEESFGASLTDHEELWVHAVKKGVNCRKAAQHPDGAAPPVAVLLGSLSFEEVEEGLRKRLRRLGRLAAKAAKSQVGSDINGKSEGAAAEAKAKAKAKAQTTGGKAKENGSAGEEVEVEEDGKSDWAVSAAATLLAKFLGMDVVCASTLTAAQENERLRDRRVGLLLVTADLAADVFGYLNNQSESKSAPVSTLDLQTGCTVALIGLPEGGLCSLHAECAVIAYGFEQDADKKHILNLKKGQALQKEVRGKFHRVEGLEVRGYGIPVNSVFVVYADGWAEALQSPLVKMRPYRSEKQEEEKESESESDGKPEETPIVASKEKKVPSKTSKETKRWELMDTDENIYGLPQGLAPHVSPISTAAEWLLGGNGLAFTGAGISRESGVPTFRDGDGLWERYDAMEVSSIGGFAGEPAKVWDFEREFNDILDNCSGPNDGHRALAEMEKLGRVSLVVTQNVDGFQQLAGSREVLELHGSEVHAICLNKECKHRVEMKYIFEEAKKFEDNKSSAATNRCNKDKENEKTENGKEEEEEKHGLKQKRESQDTADGHAVAIEQPSYWSDFAMGWGVRWPSRPDDSKLQQTVRSQLEGLQRAKKRRKTGNKDGPGGKSGNGDAKSSSSSDSDSIISESSSASSSSSSSSSAAPGPKPKEPAKKALTKACTARPLTEEQLNVGPPRCRVPICPKCRNGVLKPDGIFFGESLEPAVLERSVKQSAKSKVVLMVGTSGTVDPAAKLPLVAKKRSGAKIIEVNIGETRLSPIADLCLRGPSAYILPKVLEALKKHPKFSEVIEGAPKTEDVS